MIKYVAILILLVGVVLFIIDLLNKKKGKDGESDLSVYEKKPYLFDTNSEFSLYKVLLELFGEKYFIFPQINYSHLIQPRKTNWEEERKYRSRIDRKSADFVMCYKEKIVPVLIIELDGSAHNIKSKQARDEFIDEITKIVDLPILHIKTSNVDKEYIRGEINNKLKI